ncbi:MAG: isoprenylcysteine carboxylmethyltransferase family protein [Bacteroidetes bacterium]|nr:isoprenylcysteine carboxylmethyltransferase family protein [Bacteroidota bacterium]
MKPTSPESKPYALALVIVQFVSGLLIIYFGSQTTAQLWPMTIVVLGVLVALTGVLTMRLGNFRVLPIPKTDAVLVTGGIYGVIRHPMYTGVLLATLGFALNDGSPPVMILWVVLLADLVMKLRYEERLLAARFPAYEEYRKRTDRLIPFIW